MLIYGNTPGDIVRKIQSKLNGKGRMKKIILLAVVLAIGYFGLVKADETQTPQETMKAISEVPGKLGNHFQKEWVDIKSYQANSWAEVKFKLQALKEKFQSE